MKKLIYIVMMVLLMNFVGGCQTNRKRLDENLFVAYPSNYSFVSDTSGEDIEIEVPIFTNDKEFKFTNIDNILDSNLKFNNEYIPAKILEIKINEEPNEYENLGEIYIGSLKFSIPSYIIGESVNTYLELEDKEDKVSLFLGDISFKIVNDEYENSDIEYALLNGVYGFDENSSPYISGVIIDLSINSSINIDDINLGIESYGFKKEGVKIFTADERDKLIENYENQTLDKIIENAYNKNINKNNTYKINQIDLNKGEYSIYIPVELNNDNTFNSFNIACKINYNNGKSKVIYPFLSGKKLDFSQEEITKVIELSK